MNIEHYLSELLYDYQCVIIPNFGAFLTESITATFQEKNNTFYPPKKVLSFNVYIKNNDGLLANHLAKAEGISYDNAVKQLDILTKEWIKKLNNKEFIILKNIGILKHNNENNITFEAFEHLNFLKTSFGLNALISPVITREIINTVQQKKQKDQEIENQEKAPQTVTTSLEKITIPLESKAIKNNPFKNFMRYAALLALGGAGITVAFMQYTQKQTNKQVLVVQEQVQKEIQLKLQEATFFIDNPITITPEVKTLSFHLVAGSFRSEANANKAVKELKEKGFLKAKIMHKNEQGLIPVYYGSYPTFTEAQYELNQIQKKDNPEAWMLIKNL